MPTFNLAPILFPKPKKDDVYDMLNDLLQIKEKQFAIDEGGTINNPVSYDPLIAEYERIANDPTMNANDRRDAEKKMNDLMIKKLKADLDQKKQLDAGDLKQMVNQDLRELEFEFPGSPIAYATGAMMKYNDVLYGTSEREGLNQLIEILKSNYTDTSKLEIYRDECLEELSKYSDIMDAYEIGDMTRLSEYAVVYTPYAGKVKAMQIIFRGNVDPNHSQPTDLRYSRDLAGNLAIVPDTGEANGMQVYFVRANVTQGDKYTFGNQQFTLGVNSRWEAENPAAFDYKRVKHAPLHSIPSGSFVKDSKDKLFYVNRDRSFYPVRDIHKEELGFTEDKVYNLSPDEEINLLPGAIDRTVFPVMERYNREVSMSDFDYWRTFREELGPSARKLAGAADIGLQKTGELIKAAPARFWEFTKKSWQEARERDRKRYEEMKLEREKPQLKEAPSWGLEAAKPTKVFEVAKEFIKSFLPKF